MSDADNGSLLAAFYESGGVPFKTVMADPAWPSSSSPGKRKHWMKTNMKPRYGTIKAKDLLELPVSTIADQDAVLVMWATWMHLALAMRVIEAWGFTYCAGFPWLKTIKLDGRDFKLSIANLPKRKVDLIPGPIFGPGVWAQGCTELILIARRGRPFGSLGNPRPARKGLIVAPRGEHSEKPVELRQWIETKFPFPMIELFARNRYPGWTSWGNEL